MTPVRPRTMLSILILSLVVGIGAPGVAASDLVVTEPAAATGAIAAHIARLDFSEMWSEDIDWSKLDQVTRELARDRLVWNALCVQASGRSIADSQAGLTAAESERFIAGLAHTMKDIAAGKHLVLSRNEWAIAACAVLPMQQAKGAGQKYVTTLGDTSRLGVAIARVVRTGVNCGDACVLTCALLRALGIDCRFVGCHRKAPVAGQPAGHAMVEYFESDDHGARFGHLVDVTNLTVQASGGDPRFRPAMSRFQLVGDALGRLQFLVSCAYAIELPSMQGLSPPFSSAELASRELEDAVTVHWDARVEPRSVVLDSAQLEVSVPEGKSLCYKVTIGTDVPDGAVPIARMYHKGTDGQFQSLGEFMLHRRIAGEVRLVWDRLLDGLTPGDYRADFYVSDGPFGARRAVTYVGEQIIHYGAKEQNSK